MENKDLYELLIKYKKGDKQCFHVFYENLKKPVFYNIYSILKNKEASEDILQETFIKLLENIDKINSQDSILGYLMVIIQKYLSFFYSDLSFFYKTAN